MEFRLTVAPRHSVVLLDHERWHVFEQVAAVVRRSGHRSIRITTAPTGRSGRWLDRLVFTRAIYLSDVRELAGLGDLLAGEDIADVQWTEQICAAVPPEALGWLPPAITESLRIRQTLVDKHEVVVAASAKGINVADQLCADEVSDEDAIGRFGLPLVIKAKLGAYGAGVRIASTPSDVREACSDLAASRERVVFERFILGELQTYAAFIARGEFVQEMTYRATRYRRSTLEPPLEFTMIDRPQLIEFGRSACEGLGLTGVVNLQTIRGADGEHTLMDLNLRPFGIMLSFPPETLDTATGYLYAIGCTNTPPAAARPRPGDSVVVFPSEIEEISRYRGRIAAARALAGQAWRHRAVFGQRYLLLAAFRTLSGRSST
jgi:hypothetical protein